MTGIRQMLLVTLYGFFLEPVTPFTLTKSPQIVHAKIEPIEDTISHEGKENYSEKYILFTLSLRSGDVINDGGDLLKSKSLKEGVLRLNVDSLITNSTAMVENNLSSSYPHGAASSASAKQFPGSNGVSSSPQATVAMIQSFVDDMVNRRDQHRPGYIMINSRNPQVIQQIADALTRRYGSSSVIQDPQAIQNIVGESQPNGPVARPSTPMRVFPYDDPLRQRAAEESRTDVNYIKSQIEALADVSIASGLLVNDTLVSNSKYSSTDVGANDNNRNNNTTTPVINLSHQVYTTEASNLSEDISSIDLNNNINILSSNALASNIPGSNNFPSGLKHMGNLKPDDEMNNDDEENLFPDNIIHINQENILENNFVTDLSKYDLGGTVLDKIEESMDNIFVEEEKEETAEIYRFEDYYEYIDGEKVLSPSKFMRRGGPTVEGDYEVEQKQDWQESGADGGNMENYDILLFPPVDNEVVVALRSLGKPALATLGLLGHLDDIPVRGQSENGSIVHLPDHVLHNLFRVHNAHKQSPALRESSVISGVLSTVSDEDNLPNAKMSAESGSLSPNQEMQRPADFKVSHYRQSDANQPVPLGFFPPRPEPGQHQPTAAPGPQSQLSPEQQSIVAQLPEGMRDVVASIVMAVQVHNTTPATPVHQPYPQSHYPFVYPHYPFYPPPYYPILPNNAPPTTPTQAPSHHTHHHGSHDHGTQGGNENHHDHRHHDAHASHSHHDPPVPLHHPVSTTPVSIPNTGGSGEGSDAVLSSRQGEVGDASVVRDNDNSGHGTVGLLCRNQGTSGFCENRLSIGGAPRQPDRNQGLLQLRQDPSQMGHGRPSGGGFVNFRPPQQGGMQMGGPVLNVVLPEATSSTPPELEDVGPLIDPSPPQVAENDAPQMMDRQEMNSLLQSLFSSPTLLLLGIIFATSAAYMAIAMEEQAAQQRFQQAQLAAAFNNSPPFQGRGRREAVPPLLPWPLVARDP